MKEKKIKLEKVKKKYLRKLSVELIKRGVTNEQIKSTLEDVSFSLDEYTTEFKPKNLEELANQFGSPVDFCDNNSLIRSKVGSVGQISLITLMICSVLVVPILVIYNLYSVYLLPRAIPTTVLTPNTFFLGVNGVNSGYGIIGTIFGLNVFIWMLYQFYKDKFSQNDIREAIKGVILVLYWFLVVFCFSLILHSYISHYVIIADMWNQDMQLIILEGMFRWVALESVLLITAIFYTNKYRKQYHKMNNVKQESYLTDRIGMLVVVFILTGFISGGPGMGLLVIAIGIVVFFLTKFTGKALFLGFLAILLQLGAYISRIFDSGESSFFYRLWIVFGFQNHITYFWDDDPMWFFIIVVFCLLMIGLIFSIKNLKKNKRKIFPHFKVPKGKTALVSIFLVVLTLVAVLGTQPQKVSYLTDYNLNLEETHFEFDQSFRFLRKGKVSISIYTYIEETIYLQYYNGTVVEETSHLSGSWYLIWTLEGSVFGTFRIEGNFDNYTTPSYSNDRNNVSIQFISLDIEGPGVLKYHLNLIPNNLTLTTPYLQLQYSSMVPWLPNWYDVVILVCVIFFSFFKWDEKVLQPKTTLKKGED